MEGFAFVLFCIFLFCFNYLRKQMARKDSHLWFSSLHFHYTGTCISKLVPRKMEYKIMLLVDIY